MKVIEKDNFIDIFEEGMEDDEYHAWRRVTDWFVAAHSTSYWIQNNFL